MLRYDLIRLERELSSNRPGAMNQKKLHFYVNSEKNIKTLIYGHNIPIFILAVLQYNTISLFIKMSSPYDNLLVLSNNT